MVSIVDVFIFGNTVATGRQMSGGVNQVPQFLDYTLQLFDGWLVNELQLAQRAT